MNLFGKYDYFKEGAFALAFKSRHFPGQVVATRRGSPLVVGIKSDSVLNTSHFPVYFSKDSGWIWKDDHTIQSEIKGEDAENLTDLSAPRTGLFSKLWENNQNLAELIDKRRSIRPFDTKNWQVEYFLASDAR